MAKHRYHRTRKNPRRHRRARKNPSTTTWLLIGGAALVGAYIFWPKKAAATTPSNPSSLPGTPENCKVSAITMSSYMSLLATAQTACKTNPSDPVCANAPLLAQQVTSLQTTWPAACGPVPMMPAV